MLFFSRYLRLVVILAGLGIMFTGQASQDFSEWVLQAMHKKELVLDDNGNIYYQKDNCVNADGEWDIYCICNPYQSDAALDNTNDDGQSPPQWDESPFDFVSTTEDGQQYCKGDKPPPPLTAGSPVPPVQPRSYYRYFLSINQPADQQSETAQSKTGQSAVSRSMSYKTQSTIPDFLKAPERDIDIGVYNLSNFEQVNTANGKLKLVHHDIHYPGNGGLDIDLYRVQENRRKFSRSPGGLPYSWRGYSGIQFGVHDGYYMTAGFMPFNGVLCKPNYENSDTPIGYTYFDEQFNRHVFMYDNSRYEQGNAVADETRRAPAFYSDTGWKAVCQLDTGHYRGMGGNDPSYNYVDNVKWTLWRPDGREITLTMDTSFTKDSAGGGISARPKALLKTRERDSFGNTLTYEWYKTGNKRLHYPGHDFDVQTWAGLKSITASDGRTLTFDWPRYRPATISHQTRRYIVGSEGTGELTITDDNGRQWQYKDNKAVMPDGRVWQHDYNASKDIITKVINPLGGIHFYEHKESSYPDPSNSVYARRKQVLTTRTINNGGQLINWQYEHSIDSYKVPRITVTAPDNSKIEYTYWNASTAYGDNLPNSSWQGSADASCFRKGKLKEIKFFNRNNQQTRFQRYEYGVNYRNKNPLANCSLSNDGFSFVEKVSTLDNNQWYIDDYIYTQDINTPSWRNLKPVQIIRYNAASGVSKTTNYSYFVKDRSECSKVTLGNNPILKNDKDYYWKANWACDADKNDLDGSYFVAAESEKTDGVPLGITTGYNAINFAVEAVNRYGVLSQQTWDGSGNMASATDVAGNTTTFSRYDKGIPKTEVRPDGVSVTRTVDPIGAVASVTINGKTTAYGHTPVGLINRVDFPKRSSEAVTADYHFGFQPLTTPDAAVVAEIPHTIIKRGSFTQTLYYDGLGREIRRVVSDGITTITHKTDYDGRGRVSKRYYPDSNNGVSYTYDEFGRVIKACDPRGCSQTAYNGDTVTVTDANGQATTYSYNRFGADLHAELIKVQAPEGVATDITRNIKGDITAVAQGGLTRHLTYFTDRGLGLQTVNDPERGVLTYQRDNAGRVINSSVGGMSESLSYDALNRVNAVNFSNAVLNKTFTYDAWGRLTQAGTPLAVWHYTYDDNGNHLSSTLSYNNGQTLTARYQYDNMDHLTAMTYPGGTVLDYRVDGLGRVQSISKSGSPIVGSAAYHANHAIKSLALGNGHTYATALDDRQMVSRIDAGGIRLNYAYDPLGNVTTIQQSGQADKSMTYDGLNRLRRVSYGNGGAIDYGYDTRSNLLSKRVYNVEQADDVNWTYEYDNNNRLSRINGSAYRFAYDAAGNITADGRHTYRYHANNKLADIDGDIRQYYYDANDNRLLVGTKNTPTIQFYDNGTLMGEYQFDGTPIREYVQLGNHTIAQLAADVQAPLRPGWLFADSFEGTSGGGTPGVVQTTYLYKDALGSTIAKADDKGNILWQENRLPFGKNTQLSSSQIDKNPLQYTNAPLDSHSGLTYLKARYYNAEIGRFYASDPVWYDSDNSQSFNRYAYGNNNPYKYVDPTGEVPWIAVPIAIGVYFGTADVAQAPTYNGDIHQLSLPDRAIIGGAGFVAGVAINAMGIKEAAQTAFEMATGVDIPTPSIRKMYKHAISQYKSHGLTHAGRALTKHPNIVDVYLPKDKVQKALIDKFGSQKGINNAAAEVLKNIMRNGKKTTRKTKAFGEVTEFKLKSGKGARFRNDTEEFTGFLGRDL